MNEPDPLPRDFKLDRFLIEGTIGPTGFGRLYKATDTQSNEVVALNVLAPRRRGPKDVRRFQLAFRLAFDANHGRVHEYVEWEGIPFAVLTYSPDPRKVVDLSKEMTRTTPTKGRWRGPLVR
jgi:serine/threonine protein kinase